MNYYKAYGLNVQSEKLLHELQPHEGIPETIDLFIRFTPPPIAEGENNWKRHPRFISRRPQDEGGDTWLKIYESTHGNFTRLRYEDGVQFTIDQAAQNLWIDAPDELSISYVTTYLVNQGFGLIFRLRNRTCLHASAIVVDEYAVIFSAPAGFGKSTLATHFAMRGHTVISDDVCVLDVRHDGIYVQPGYPRLRLSPETAEAIFGTDHKLGWIAEGWDKFYLPLNEKDFRYADRAYPLGAIYLIKSWGDSTTVKPLHAAQAIPTLMETTYLYYLIDSPIRATDFNVLAQLVGSIPVLSLEDCVELSRIDQTCDIILQHFKTLAED